jgi:hypothetical protein
MGGELMTYTEQLLAQNDAKDTNWANAIKAGVLGLLISGLQFTGPIEQELTTEFITPSHIQDTHRTAEVGTNRGYFDLLGQFARVYEYLSTETVKLDDEAKRLLYSNLWSMYA